MSIRKAIQKQIEDLEKQIATAQGDKAALQETLQRLKMQDFEEDLRESPEQQLLKG
jgi:hypothetical protein